MANLGTIKDFKKEYPLLATRAYEYCNAKGFPAFKNGGEWLIDLDKVDKYLESKYQKQAIPSRKRY